MKTVMYAKNNVSFTDLKLAMDPKNYQETVIE